MARTKKEKKEKTPAQPPAAQVGDPLDADPKFTEIAQNGLTVEKVAHAKQDVHLLAAALSGVSLLLSRDWSPIREACNERGEGEIIVNVKIAFPFGKQDAKVQTNVSFEQAKKFTDQVDVKVDDNLLPGMER